MQVKSKEPVFVGGRRLRVSPATGLTEAFEYVPKKGRKVPDHYVPAETEKVEKPKPGGQANQAEKHEPTKKELMAELAAAGIPYKETMNKTELQGLLDEFKKSAAPAASAAPSKEHEGGVGNQDVI